MSDEHRRRRSDDDFGPPLFGDEPTGEMGRTDLSFRDGDTGPLPHWTEPATGEVPRVAVHDSSGNAGQADHDDVDVWSTFAEDGPVWSDDAPRPAPAADPSGAMSRVSGTLPITPSREPREPREPRDQRDPTGGGSREPSASIRREPGRITIGTDPTGGERRPAPGSKKRSAADVRRTAGRPTNPTRPVPRQAATAATAGRDLPAAVVAGVLMLAVFFGAAVSRKPLVMLAIIVVVLGLAAYEYFDKVTEKGYQPALWLGLAGCVAAPLATYWVGVVAIPLVLTLSVIAASVTYMAGSDVDSNPLPNVAITILAIVWIGVMGAHAAMILDLGTAKFAPWGTDTLVLTVIGVVANDTGAYFVGSAIGKRPLRQWISPGKTVEGLIGGTVATLLAMLLISMFDKMPNTWNSAGSLLELGLVISIAAPLGDLTESMFKRNLGIKDFGTLIKGHGGVLDRFDAFLFVLPAVYYLTMVIQA